MTVTYDKYYQTENLFGEPYPELMEFMANYQNKGKVLDLGCGQGRNAIALARLGYNVTGIDNSKVGIEQMKLTGEIENLNLNGQVGDIYTFKRFDEFDIILLDSIFHFEKKDKDKEIGLINKIVTTISSGSLTLVCIQDTGNNVHILNNALNNEKELTSLADKKFTYTFEDSNSRHKSQTAYRMIAVKK